MAHDASPSGREFLLVFTPTIRKFGERPFRTIARHEMVISVSATIISKREITVSNPEIIFNGITGEIISDAEGMDFTTGKMTSEMSEMMSVTREMKTDAVVTTSTFAAVTTVTAGQTIIIAKTY